MKFALASLAFASFLSTGAFAESIRFEDAGDRLLESNKNQTEYYKRTSCAGKMVDLVKERFASFTVEVISGGDVLTLDKQSLRFCGIDDIDQGSYNIERSLTLCAEFLDKQGASWSGSVYAITEGDMFCEGERLLEIKGFWVH